MLRGTVVITIKAFTIQDFLQLQSLSVCLLVEVLSSFLVLMIVQNLFYLSFASGTSSDVLLALSLCFYLWRCQTGFTRTDNLIQTLMKYTINTSALVAWAPVLLFNHQTRWIQIFRLDALVGLITYITMPHNFIFLGKSTQTSVEGDFWSFCEAFYLLLSKRESKVFLFLKFVGSPWNLKQVYLNSYLATWACTRSLDVMTPDFICALYQSQCSEESTWGLWWTCPTVASFRTLNWQVFPSVKVFKTDCQWRQGLWNLFDLLALAHCRF